MVTGVDRAGRAYTWFVGATAAWFMGAGMQQVLFSWLVVGELREGPRAAGAAQMCQTLPALLFLLIGGAIADRLDRRRLLVALHVAAALAAAGVSIVVAAGRISLPLLVVYALGWGTLHAFAQPARDSLLSDVAGPDLMRAVTGVTLAQSLAQMLGARLAGVGDTIGSGGALALQAAVVLAGTVAVLGLPRGTAHPLVHGTTLAAVRAGLREVRRSEVLFPVALMVAADGLFYMGPFIVLCPLIVRDVYGGNLGDLSLAVSMLTLGTIGGSAALLLRGGIRRRGRAFLLALLGVALCLVGISLAVPFPAFVAILFVWGVCHSIFFNTSRTLFQESASPTHRARVLSVHSLGLLGMAPLSNLAAGIVAGLLGPLAGCALAGGAMIVLTSNAWARTPIRRLE